MRGSGTGNKQGGGGGVVVCACMVGCCVVFDKLVGVGGVVEAFMCMVVVWCFREHRTVCTQA